MNPLPRSVAMALFVVLAALVALLGTSVWRGVPAAQEAAARDSTFAAPAGERSAARSGAIRALVLSQRAALTLAGLALVLSLIVVVTLRARRDSPAPLVPPAREIGALARLAETSVAQSQELSRERDVRRRAEEDARLKQELLTQSLDEKIRLGRDLHDGIIQSLYAAGLTLESVRPLVRSQPEEAERRLEQMRARLNEAIRDVRAYIAGLTPEQLRRASFGHALSAMLAELGAGRAAEFDLQIDDEAAAQLTPAQSIETLQIAREAVSNALRHGRATRVVLRMHKGDAEVGLLVHDNGSGFDPARRAAGHGLGNMRARAGQIGASLRITSQPAEGTRVLVTIPILQPSVA